MPTVRFEGQEREVAEGASILDACEELGMPFGCTEGICHTCRCMVVEGMKNLGALNDREEDADLDDGERLACQCTIRVGTVEFTIG